MHICIHPGFLLEVNFVFFSWYAIPKESGNNITPMSDQKKTQIRMALSDLKLIIIDELSEV